MRDIHSYSPQVNPAYNHYRHYFPYPSHMVAYVAHTKALPILAGHRALDLLSAGDFSLLSFFYCA